MITAAQLRAARALLGIDQKTLAEMSMLSTPTIQRMEASDGAIRGNVDSLMKLIGGLQAAGLELIGGVGVRPHPLARAVEDGLQDANGLVDGSAVHPAERID